MNSVKIIEDISKELKDKYGNNEGDILASLYELNSVISEGGEIGDVMSSDGDWRVFIKENFVPFAKPKANIEDSIKLSKDKKVKKSGVKRKRRDTGYNPVRMDVTKMVLNTVKSSLTNENLSVPVHELWRAIRKTSKFTNGDDTDSGAYHDMVNQMNALLGNSKKQTGINEAIGIIRARSQANIFGKGTIAVQQLVQPFVLGDLTFKNLPKTIASRFTKKSLNKYFTDEEKQQILDYTNEEQHIKNALLLESIRDNTGEKGFNTALRKALLKNKLITLQESITTKPVSKLTTMLDTQNRNIVFEQIVDTVGTAYDKYKSGKINYEGFKKTIRDE